MHNKQILPASNENEGSLCGSSLPRPRPCVKHEQLVTLQNATTTFAVGIAMHSQSAELYNCVVQECINTVAIDSLVLNACGCLPVHLVLVCFYLPFLPCLCHVCSKTQMMAGYLA